MTAKTIVIDESLPVTIVKGTFDIARSCICWVTGLGQGLFNPPTSTRSGGPSSSSSIVTTSDTMLVLVFGEIPAQLKALDSTRQTQLPLPLRLTFLKESHQMQSSPQKLQNQQRRINHAKSLSRILNPFRSYNNPIPFRVPTVTEVKVRLS